MVKFTEEIFMENLIFGAMLILTSYRNILTSYKNILVFVYAHEGWRKHVSHGSHPWANTLLFSNEKFCGFGAGKPTKTYQNK